MMTSNEFKKYRKECIARQAPHLVTELSNITALGENNFSVNGVDFTATGKVAKTLDKLTGVGDAKLVESTSGALGLRNMRNYFTTAKSIESDSKVLFIADPDKREVVEAIPLKQDYIPMEGFFDFVEFFAHTNNYEIDKIHISESMAGRGNVYLRPVNPTFSKVMEGEEFMDNGIFLNWDSNQIEGGSYFERLVCANGAVEMVKSNNLKIHSLADDNIHHIVAALSDGELMRRGFERYSRKLAERVEITASMSELNVAHRNLCSVGVNAEMAELIVPYNSLLEEYKTCGINISNRENMAKSNMTLWTLYNNLTQFATHNTEWSENDMRRARLIESSNFFLNKKPDIKHYLEVA